MKKTRIQGITFLAALTATLAVLAGCSHAGSKDVVGWSSADKPPSGLFFSNGMPPSSVGPSPEWYAKRFNRARGIGEALKRAHLAMWDRDHGTFTYYIGGELYAQFHPWEHYLQIRTDKKEEGNLTCRWAEDGTLAITEENGPSPAGADETCKQLLDTLANHVAPSGILSSG